MANRCVCPLFAVLVVICSNKLSHTHVWGMAQQCVWCMAAVGVCVCDIIYYVIKYYPDHVCPHASLHWPLKSTVLFGDSIIHIVFVVTSLCSLALGSYYDMCLVCSCLSGWLPFITTVMAHRCTERNICSAETKVYYHTRGLLVEETHFHARHKRLRD